MIIDPAVRLVTPEDDEAPERVERLRQVGLGDHPEPELDEFARNLARDAATPFAMVNFIDGDRQYFAGLYAADAQGDPPPGQSLQPPPDDLREMAHDHGYCMNVVTRKLPLALENVSDYARFAGNPVVDEIGIRSYLGAPIVNSQGEVLGTICVIDRQPRPWGDTGLQFIKQRAAELARKIEERRGPAPEPGLNGHHRANNIETPRQ